MQEKNYYFFLYNTNQTQKCGLFIEKRIVLNLECVNTEFSTIFIVLYAAQTFLYSLYLK